MRSSDSSHSHLAKKLAGTALALASVVALAGCSSGSSSAASTPAATDGFNQAAHDMLPDSIKSGGDITLGALWETPPAISVAADDPTVPIGITPDLAALIAPILGVKVTWSNMQWPAQLPGVQSGTVDALWGQVTITAAREQSIVDLVPYQQTTESLLLPAGNPKKVSALADMCGLTVAVPVGSSQAASVQSVSDAKCASNPIKMADYQGATSAVQALRAGTVDAWLDTTSSQDVLVASATDVFSDVVVPADEIPTQYSGIAVSKDQPGLTNALTAAMKILVDNGSYAAVMNKYSVAAAAITADQVTPNPITGTAVGAVAATTTPTP